MKHFDSPTASVMGLLKQFNIPSTKNHVDRILLNHPDYPSLLSLAESLPEWGVKTEGVRGGIGDLSEADYPSIALLKSGEFAVLERLNNGDATYTIPGQDRRTLGLDQFSEVWSGVLLRAYPQKNAAEPDFERHLGEERRSALFRILTGFGLPLVSLVILVYGLVQTGHLSTLIPLVFAKIVGLVFCGIMVSAAMGKGELLQSLCPMGKVVNCARVMRSPAGSLFGVSMAEWGLIYFGGGIISAFFALLFGQFASDLFFLGLLGLFALPYTVFSVIYQGLVVRSWCWICLVIMALFWTEAYLLYHPVMSGITNGLWGEAIPVSLILGFSLVALAWLYLRSIIEKSRSAETLEFQVTQMRRQPEYIQFQLSKAEETDMGRVPFEVEIGPPDAKICFVVVVNPLCGHCWEAFNQLAQLIHLGKGHVKGAIRFLVTPSKEETPTETEVFIDREVSIKVLSLAAKGQRDQVYQALSSWFEPDRLPSKSKYNRWQSDYSPDSEEARKRSVEVLNQHLDWARTVEIVGTPTLFFNGLRLPLGIQLEDLKYFLMRQIENQE